MARIYNEWRDVITELHDLEMGMFTMTLEEYLRMPELFKGARRVYKHFLAEKGIPEK